MEYVLGIAVFGLIIWVYVNICRYSFRCGKASGNKTISIVLLLFGFCIYSGAVSSCGDGAF